jgi:hypothetical protein
MVLHGKGRQGLDHKGKEPIMSKNLTQIVASFETIANTETVTQARRAVEKGEAIWIWDPEVDGVVGLVLVGNTNRALVVVYDEGSDFEADEEHLAAVGA